MPRSSRRPRRRQEGFALLVVVLIVALIGVTAVALLDIVNVDLSIVGQHKRTLTAQANAYGALVEVASDANLSNRLPTLTTNQLRYRYADQVAGNWVRDPDNAFGTAPMNPTNSAYIQNLGTSVEEGYQADVRLLRVGNPQDTGLTTAQTITYEITVVSSVNNGAATKEVRALMTQTVSNQNGTIQTETHAR